MINTTALYLHKAVLTIYSFLIQAFLCPAKWPGSLRECLANAWNREYWYGF